MAGSCIMGVHHGPCVRYGSQNLSATIHPHTFPTGIGILVILTNLMKGAFNFPFMDF